MYSVCVSTVFNAVHAVTICGIDETPHDHEWKVDVVIAGDTLSDDGLLIDFIEIEKYLADIIEPLLESNLNQNDVLNGDNPSAERVALYFYDKLSQHIQGTVRVQSVTITEAPNCKATYTP